MKNFNARKSFFSEPIAKLYSSDPGDPDIDYFYDEANHGSSKGRLTRIEYGSSVNSETFDYDLRGRVTNKTRTIDDISKDVIYAYDSMDRQTRLTYPDGEVVNINQTQQGVEKVFSAANDYLKEATFTAFNRVAYLKYGNDVVTDYRYYDSASDYDPSAQTYFSFRLREITTSPTNILRLRYEYDKARNVKKKTDLNTSSYSESYSYDHLDRLTYASSIQSGYGTKNYSYDEIGNMLTKDGKSYTYGNGNHQVTADAAYTYLYDANGNMMSRKQGSVVVQSYTYNFDNMIKDVDEGGNLSHYSYFDGQRVRKEENGIITRYFFPEYEEEEDTNISQTRSIKYYFANNQRIARVDSINGLAYYHQDHLGSSTRMTNISQSVVRSQSYKPYGQDSYSSGSTFVKYKFTGKEEDATGLYYYEARYYDPSLGRFLQADTIVPDPDDPQS